MTTNFEPIAPREGAAFYPVVRGALGEIRLFPYKTREHALSFAFRKSSVVRIENERGHEVWKRPHDQLPMGLESDR